jgi:hypothetical protein
MLSSDRHRVYKSLETDEEFRARLKGYYIPRWNTGNELDEYVWDQYKKQRRIVERSTER